MGIKQLIMHVDNALERPSFFGIATVIKEQKGVDGLSIVIFNYKNILMI